MADEFTHLHVHTQYSLLDGAIRVKDLFPRLKERGMSTVAVTDHGNMFGAIDVYTEAKAHDVKVIFGCETYVAAADLKDRTNRRNYHLVLLAENDAGYKNLSCRDPACFGPGAQFDQRRVLEPPGDDEGFAAIEVRPFVRLPDTAGVPALIVDADDLVRSGRPTDVADVRIADGAAAAITAWRAAGWVVVATSWQPALVGPPDDVRAQVAAIDARTVDLLGAPLPIATCWHPAGPPRCWCRKPLPGLGRRGGRRCRPVNHGRRRR